ncbi:MAG: hypothetical protein GY795_35210 [Desulfobacterales bacterium]|nr:hypothetical protein [Desulfobacterales bacterium]
MKKIQSSETNEMLPEYNFDYTKARPNRFIKTADKEGRSIILDPDVARVFHALFVIVKSWPFIRKPER